MSHAEEFAKQWRRQRDVLETLLERVPDGKENFAPWDGAMTLGQLAIHIATVGQMFAHGAATGEISQPQAPWTTMADVRSAVHELTGQTQTTIDSISDERWEAMVDLTKVFGREMKVSAMLYSMRDHEIHHKGQMFVYARMAGADNLPFFT